MWRVLPVPHHNPLLTANHRYTTQLLNEPAMVGITCVCGKSLTIWAERGSSEMQCACGRQFRLEAPRVHVWEPVAAGAVE